MNALLVTTVIAVVTLVSVGGQSQLRPRSFCFGQDVYPDGGNCTQRYTRCDGGIFITGSCIEGMMLGDTKRCEIRPECGPSASPPVSRRRLRRGKRQASSVCPQFDCPANLLFYIYPDWIDCTQFYTCNQGNIDVISCSEFNFQYFNPNMFSCEVDLSFGPVTPQNNVCVNRATPFGK